MTTAVRWHRGAIVGLALAIAGAAWATESAPPRRSAPPDDAAQARVIVKFKAGAATVRSAPLGAARTAASTQTQLQVRADAVGRRLGLTLSTGRALSERAQVLTASGLGSDALVRRLSQDSEVEYAVVDRRYTWLSVPNDPLYLPVGSVNPAVGQWYLKAPAGVVRSSINAATAWDTTTGQASVVVAVLDTGVRTDHPDLAGRTVPGYDMVSGSVAVANDGDGRDADPSDPGDWVTLTESNANGTFNGCTVEDSSWHGTQVSGLIAATQNNSVGISGVAPGAKVLPVRVLGKCGGYESDITAGMRWAAGIAVSGLPTNPNPAKVLNMSLGGDGTCSANYADAVSDVIAQGAAIVVAAGNSAGHALGQPANCAGVIAVAGVRHVGTKVGYSDLGAAVTVSAPAGNCENASGSCLYPIISTTNRGTTTPVAGDASYTNGTSIATSPVGTSFAAPLVAGTAALMLSVNPALTPAQIAALLKSSSRTFPTTGGSANVQQCRTPTGVDQLECYCTTTTCGAGMLDASAAVVAAAGGSGTTGVSAIATATPALPDPGQLVQLSAATSVLATGRSVVSTTWSIVDGGGIVTAFEGGVNNTTAVSVRPSAVGQFTVRVDLVDDQGATGFSNLTVYVGSLSVNVNPATSNLKVGQTVQLNAADVTSSAGGPVTYGWAVVSGDTVVALTGDVTGASVRVSMIGVGTGQVRLTVTDGTGKQGTATWTGTVTEALPVAASTDAGGGGGGAVALAELAALLALVAALAVGARRRGT